MAEHPNVARIRTMYAAFAKGDLIGLLASVIGVQPRARTIVLHPRRRL